MKDLLLEIGTEEMPANIMPPLVNQFKDLAEEKLKEARLSFTDVKIYATPRRLTAYVQGTADRQLDEEIDKSGPSVQAAYDKATPVPHRIQPDKTRRRKNFEPIAE